MTKEKLFRNIAKKVLNEILQKLPGLCPDQYVGQIGKLKQLEDTDKNTGKKKSNFPERINVFTKDFSDRIEKNSSYMILILESPHKDEFKGEIGPAKGPTGRNIRKHIADIFGKEYKDYHLILMNAIPFQCSLGVNPKIFRDKVFVKTWKDFGESFFQTRLTNLIKLLKEKENDVVVVNACTQGSNNLKEFLCCKVCKIIIEILCNRGCGPTAGKKQSIGYYHIHHPASWERKSQEKKFYEIDTEAIKLCFEYPGNCAKCMISEKEDCYGMITCK